MTSAKLIPTQDANDGLFGFTLKDVQLEIRRASRLVSVEKREMIFHSFFLIEIFPAYRHVFIASKEVLALAVVVNHAGNHFTFPVHLKIIVYLNSPDQKFHSVMFITLQTT